MLKFQKQYNIIANPNIRTLLFFALGPCSTWNLGVLTRDDENLYDAFHSSIDQYIYAYAVNVCFYIERGSPYIKAVGLKKERKHEASQERTGNQREKGHFYFLMLRIFAWLW